jgi:sarcosine oxidase, subunit beta
MKPQIAIIGAGTAGCGAARRAAELGADVTVIERGGPAAGSSSLSAGVYNIQTLKPLDIEIRVRAREMIFRFERERALPLARIGNMRIAMNDADIPKLEEARAFQRELGATDSLILTKAEIQALVPDMNCDGIVAALHGPQDGHLDGYLLCTAMMDEAKDHGAKFMLNTAVLGYAKRAQRHVLHTAQGDVEADIVINAAGAWAGLIGKMLGHAAPIKPEVHEVIKVKLPHKLSYVVPMCNFYMPGQQSAGVYFRQDGEDSLIAGLHTYASVDGLEVTDPDNFSPPDGDEGFLQAAMQLQERLPIENLGFRPGWSGLYPISADGQYLIGPYKADPSVIIAGGMGGVGVTSGAAIGAVAADWAMLGKPVTVPRAEACLPDRESLK